LKIISHNRNQQGLFCSAAFIGAGLRVLSPDFWKGLKADHAPGTLHFVMQDYENSQTTKKLTLS
jgi:hypothetical protein